MATIEEMNNSMTIFFSKRTGEIKTSATGIQDMTIFGADKEDYEIIWDYIVLPIDDMVLNNTKLFLVSTEKQLVMKEEFNKYIGVSAQSMTNI